MILTALSAKSEASEERTRLLGHHNDWFVPGLYKNELRRTWSMGLLFAIVLFFALPVMNLLVFSNRSNSFEEYPERALSYLEEFFAVSNPFITVFACLGGMMCAMVVAEYLYDRRKMNFICSLPVKRQAYLVTKAAANLTWTVLAWLPSMVLMVLVALLTETMRPHLGLVFGGCFVLLAAWLCIHLYFFGLTLLACSFCGTGVMGGCMLLMLGGYVPIAVISLIGLAEMTLSRIATDYYLSAEFFSAISGVFRVFYSIAENKSVWFLLGTALLGLVFCAVAVVLTVIRQSEKAGTPFAFDRVRDIVKYLLMGLASLLGGMLFESMSYSADAFTVVWMLFGCLCGAVLCWMLCNTIFYKTPKMMFEGRRAVIIITACMMVFSVLARIDVLGLDRYIPSVVMTRHITMEHRDMPITIRDKELIRMYNDMAKNGQAAYEAYGYAPYDIPSAYRKAEEGYQKAPTMIDIGTTVWKTNYLIPIAKNTDVLYSDWVPFVTALTAQDDFADLYFERALDALDKAERVNPDKTYYTRVYHNSSLFSDTGLDANNHLTAAEIRSILEVYREEIRAAGANAMQKIYSGALNIRLDNDYFEFPLFAEYQGVTEKLREILSTGNGDSWREFNDYTYEKTFLYANVYYRGEIIDRLTEEELEDMVENGVLSGYYHVYDTPLTLVDPDYGIHIEYKVKETQKYTYVEYVNEHSGVIYESVMPDGNGDIYATQAKPTSNISYNEYNETVEACFFWGKVPAEYQQ